MMPKQSKTQKKKSGKKQRNGQKRLMPITIAYTSARNQYRVNGKGQFVIDHSEMVDIFNGTPSFVDGIVGYRINAGNINLFPWLGSIAPAFEKYCFRRLQFRWVPHCPTTASGVVSMAVDYDAADEVPADRRAMMAYKTRVTSPPYADCKLACDTGDLKSTVADRYVLSASILSPESVAFPPNVDRRLYDLGYLYIAVESDFVATCGDLWVDYCVELKQPDVTRNAADACIVHAHSVAGVSKNDPLGTISWDWIGEAFSGISKTVVGNLSLIKIPRGLKTFLADLYLTGTGLTMTSRLVDSLGAERKEFGTVGFPNYAGSDTSRNWQVEVNVNDDVTADVFWAFDTTGSTTVTGMPGLFLYPKPPF